MATSKINKKEIIEFIERVHDKDFEGVINSVYTAMSESDKAQKAFKELDLSTCTVKAYWEAENRVRICAAVKDSRFREFFALVTGQVKTFAGRSVVRPNEEEKMRSAMKRASEVGNGSL